MAKVLYFNVSQAWVNKHPKLTKASILQAAKKGEAKPLTEYQYTHAYPPWGSGDFAILSDGKIEEGAFNWDSSD